MATIQLSPRKPDALDIWEKLCFERNEAYLNNDTVLFQSLNEQLKDIRRNTGWTDSDIKEEFAVYDILLNKPYSAIIGNPNISYDLVDSGRSRNLTLNITQVSIYWKYRKYGKKHSEALSLTI